VPPRLFCSGSGARLAFEKAGVVRTSAKTLGYVVVMGCLTGFIPRAAAEGQKQTKPAPTPVFVTLHIPRLEQAPKLADFQDMQPSPAFEGKMLKVDKFVQRDPHDGAPVSQRTEAYLGYTDKNFYAVFLAFDTEPQKIRARMLRRELIDDDDQVGMFLDTFHDRRHAYVFYSNAYGIQQDGLFSETQGPDYSWDTVWRTETKMNSRGYMVLFEIPFKSLRFRQKGSLDWGVMLARVIPRNSERSYYPVNTGKLQGWLSQAGTLEGFHGISPGRNMQFIPYASVGAFRALDQRDPAGVRFTGKHVEPKAGLDSKIVIKDSLVLDATINPDFGQIESDDPQVTVNQRFEVFFPEKRPFFQENSNYFQTPLNLVFTRRIIDPLYGVRLTGKIDRWAIGTFVANDRSPGKSVIDTDPLHGNNALFGVLRVNREVGKDDSIGFIFTDRELHTAPNSFCTTTICAVGFNRVGGFDTQIKINQHWQMNAQAVTSETKFNDGTHEAGPAYQVYLERSSRDLEFNSMYQDISSGFHTDTGFVNRTDFRRFSNFIGYKSHRKGKYLVAHGPSIFELALWDHNGTRLQYIFNGIYEWDFQRQSYFGFFGNIEHERLRPVDFSSLTDNRDYGHHLVGPFFGTQYFKWLNLNGEIDLGTATNFVPRAGPPVLVNFTAIVLRGVVRPIKGLTIENTYLLTRLLDHQTNLNIFNNHIIRSKWNYQFTKEFSLRIIGQYVSTLSNPALTTLPSAKSFNGDVLFSYLLHPGTAVYIGYNSDLQNLDPTLGLDPNGNILRTRSRFLNDSREIFIKISYQLRY
jgi:hypothetical protein